GRPILDIVGYINAHYDFSQGADYNFSDGRRPVYLLALPMYTIGSFGVALSQNLLHLSIMRTLQGLGTSCFFSTGAATISDIFKLEERGRAMGVYSSASHFVPSSVRIFTYLVIDYFNRSCP